MLPQLCQSRCIGHYFAGEMASGGAAYIPTGRSLAISRQPFSLLYAAFAAPCLYPGLDLIIMLLGPVIAVSDADLDPERVPSLTLAPDDS